MNIFLQELNDNRMNSIMQHEHEENTWGLFFYTVITVQVAYLHFFQVTINSQIKAESKSWLCYMKSRKT